MKDTNDTDSQKKPKRPAKESPELRVVSIDYNPGPDAQDRLRRLFTLLVEHAARDKTLQSESGPSADDGSDPLDGGQEPEEADD